MRKDDVVGYNTFMKNQNDVTAKYYDIVSSHIKPAEITQQEIELVRNLIPVGAKILDIGCGTGRHSIPLLGLGFDVYGVEESEGMINTLRSKVKDQSLTNFQNDNIFSAHFDKKFDLIILFWNTFNEIALNNEDAEKLIQKLSELISDNGKILINSDNPASWDVSNFSHSFSTNIEGKEAKFVWKIIEHDKNLNVTTSKETLILEDKPAYEALIKQRWYSVEEYSELFHKFGFTIVGTSIKGNGELYLVATRT